MNILSFTALLNWKKLVLGDHESILHNCSLSASRSETSEVPNSLKHSTSNTLTQNQTYSQTYPELTLKMPEL